MSGGGYDDDDDGDSTMPQDPTSWQDWVAVGAVLACVGAVMVCVSLMAFVRRVRSYTPLRQKNVSNVWALALFGCVHMASLLVAEGHLQSTLTDAARTDAACQTFIYWLQYAVGFDAWFALFFARGVDYADTLGDVNWSVRQRRAIKCTTVAVLWLPGVALALAATITGDGARYVHETDACYAPLRWKAGLAAWLVLRLALLAVGAVLMYARVRPHDHFNETRVMRDVLALGAVVTTVNGVLSVMGMTAYAYGRAAFTLCVVLFHAYAFARMVGYRLYKALRRDEEYVRQFLVSCRAEAGADALSTIQDVLRYPAVELEFYAYCHEQDPVTLHEACAALHTREMRDAVAAPHAVSRAAMVRPHTPISARAHRSSPSTNGFGAPAASAHGGRAWSVTAGLSYGDDALVRPRHLVRCYRKILRWRIVYNKSVQAMDAEADAQAELTRRVIASVLSPASAYDEPLLVSEMRMRMSMRKDSSSMRDDFNDIVDNYIAEGGEYALHAPAYVINSVPHDQDGYHMRDNTALDVVALWCELVMEEVWLNDFVADLRERELARMHAIENGEMGYDDDDDEYEDEEQDDESSELQTRQQQRRRRRRPNVFTRMYRALAKRMQGRKRRTGDELEYDDDDDDNSGNKSSLSMSPYRSAYTVTPFEKL